MTKEKVIRRVGDFVAIPLGDGTFGFGRVLQEPLMGFYNLRNNSLEPPDNIMDQPIAFIIFVMNNAVASGLWPVIGNKPLELDLLTEPLFFKQDSLSKKFSIYKDSTGEEYTASEKECDALECAAVWESEHVVDRLKDLFEGRTSKWASSLRPT